MRPFLVLALSAAACTPESTLDLPAGERFVLATIDDGQISEVEVREVTTAERVQLPPGGGMIAFGLASNDLVELDAERFAFKPTLVAGGCGRCLVQPTDRHIYAVQGSSCPIPAWVQTAHSEGVSEIQVEAARERVHLTFGESCSCRLDPRTDPTPVSAQLVTPDYPFLWAAALPDGTAGLFGQRIQKLILPDGTARELEVRREGRVTAAEALGRHFVLLSVTETQTALHVLDRDLTESSRTVLAGVDPDRVHMVPLAEQNQLLVLGYRVSSSSPPAVLLCDIAPVVCQDLAPPRRRTEFPAAASVLDSGQLVVAFFQTGLEVYDAVPKPSDVVRTTNDSIELIDGSSIPHRAIPLSGHAVQDFGTLGPDLIACSYGVGGPAVLRASQADLANWRVEATFEGLCLGLHRPFAEALDVSVGSGVLRAEVGRTLRLDTSNAYPASDGSLEFLGATGAHVQVAAAEGGRILSLTGTVARTIHGQNHPRARSKLVAVGDVVYAVSSERIERLDGEGVDWQLDSDFLDVTTDGNQVFALTRGGLMAFDSSTLEFAWWIRFTPELPSAGSDRTSWHRTLTKLERIGPDDFLLFLGTGSGLEVLRLRNGEKEVVPISWDVEGTPGAEGPERFIGKLFTTSVGGVTTVVGYGQNPFLLRFFQDGDPLRVEASSLKDLDPEGIIPACTDEEWIFHAGAQVTELMGLRHQDGLTVRSLAQHPSTSFSMPLALPQRVLAAVDGPSGLWAHAFPAGERTELDGRLQSAVSTASAVYLLTSSGAIWKVEVGDP